LNATDLSRRDVGARWLTLCSHVCGVQPPVLTRTMDRRTPMGYTSTPCHDRGPRVLAPDSVGTVSIERHSCNLNVPGRIRAHRCNGTHRRSRVGRFDHASRSYNPWLDYHPGRERFKVTAIEGSASQPVIECGLRFKSWNTTAGLSPSAVYDAESMFLCSTRRVRREK